jgi:hypothetical protein
MWLVAEGSKDQHLVVNARQKGTTRIVVYDLWSFNFP